MIVCQNLQTNDDSVIVQVYLKPNPILPNTTLQGEVLK